MSVFMMDGNVSCVTDFMVHSALRPSIPANLPPVQIFSPLNTADLFSFDLQTKSLL